MPPEHLGEFLPVDFYPAVLGVGEGPYEIRREVEVRLPFCPQSGSEESCARERTPHQYPTQVRFGIPFKIPAEYDYMMPRLSENAKIKIPQVGTYFTL